VEESKQAIRKALDQGITFFDTAQAYGFGAAEEVLGEALKPEIRSGREKIILIIVHFDKWRLLVPLTLRLQMVYFVL
jgi:aryl-alcohol dehydrogenase-like predicted oxidoreductase